MGSPKQYTIAYSITWALAKRFEEKEHLRTLEKLYKNTNIGYPLGLVQTIVFRDIILGRRTDKRYNLGHRQKPVYLGDMILSLDTTMAKILDIFTSICVNHDIDTSIAMPIIEGLDMNKDGL